LTKRRWKKNRLADGLFLNGKSRREEEMEGEGKLCHLQVTVESLMKVPHP
jgi:hypothetical protein